MPPAELRKALVLLACGKGVESWAMTSVFEGLMFQLGHAWPDVCVLGGDEYHDGVVKLVDTSNSDPTIDACTAPIG